MKNFLALITGLLLLISLTACSQTKEYSMLIEPSGFSEETLKVLDLFDHELQFFDIKLDETVKSYKMAVWVYRDGEWHEDGMTSGKVDYLSNQIAVELTNDSYKLYMINENGHTSCTYPAIETDFEDSMQIGSSRIVSEMPIELDKEIPIWVKIGTKNDILRVMDITEDFRNSDCNAGIAVTLTVSDKVDE